MSTVLKIYQDVIEDVVSSVREFADDRVDEQILQELKQSWEAKLIQSKAVDNQSDLEKQAARKIGEISNGNGIPKAQTSQQQASTAASPKRVVGQVAPNNHVQTTSMQQVAPAVVETKMVPIQITLPAQPGTDVGPRVLSVQVPSTALHGNQLHKVLTGPVIAATMNLPPHIASTLLQQHVNAAFNTQMQAAQTPSVSTTTVVNTKPVIQNDGASDDMTNIASCSIADKSLLTPSGASGHQGNELNVGNELSFILTAGDSNCSKSGVSNTTKISDNINEYQYDKTIL